MTIIIIMIYKDVYSKKNETCKQKKETPQSFPRAGQSQLHPRHSPHPAAPTWVLRAAAITMPSAGIPRAQLSSTSLVSWILGANHG